MTDIGLCRSTNEGSSGVSDEYHTRITYWTGFKKKRKSLSANVFTYMFASKESYKSFDAETKPVTQQNGHFLVILSAMGSDSRIK